MTRGRDRPPPSLSTAVASAGGLPGHEELEYVLDRVSELEGRLSNIRNDLDARYDELEERMEVFHAVVEDAVGEGGQSAAVDTQENPNAEDCEVDDIRIAKGGYARIRADLDNLVEDNDIAGKDIGELSGCITEQI